MPQNILSMEQMVIDAMLEPSARKGIDVKGTTEVVLLVDSLRFLIALSEIQETLNLSLEPAEVLEVLKCRSIADVARALENFVARGQEPAKNAVPRNGSSAVA